MAEQNPDEQSPDEALKAAKDRRVAAKKNLRDSIENLRQIQQALTELHAESHRVRGALDKNKTKLEKLENRIQELESQESGIQEKIREGQERLTGQGISEDERAVVEENLRASEERLEKIQQALTGLRAESHRVRDTLEGNKTDLDRLNDQIEGKKEEEKRAKDAVSEARADLADKKHAVAQTAATVNFEMIIEPLKQIRDDIVELSSGLQFFGVTGGGYTYAAVLGASYESAFYRSYGIDIFNYTTSSDSFLSIPFSYGIAFVVGSLLLFLSAIWPAISPVRGYAEYVAHALQYIVKRPIVKRIFIGFCFIFPIIVAAGGGYCDYWLDSEDKVFIVTEPSSQQAGEYVRIGSSSTYIFLKETDTSTVLVVPLSRIVCMSENAEDGKGCESRNPGPGKGMAERVERIEQEHIALREEYKRLIATHEHENGGTKTDHKHRDYTTEALLQERIAKEMACDEGREPQVSGFIRFNKGSANFNDFSVNSEEINGFIQKVERDQIEKWGVFGFASPDGEQGTNKNLSEDRAEAVRDRFCCVLNCSSQKPDCKEHITIIKAGEDYPINGVANSRSAVIAACVKQDGIS